MSAGSVGEWRGGKDGRPGPAFSSGWLREGLPDEGTTVVRELVTLVGLLWRNWWLILVMGASFGVLAWVFAQRQTPYYTATARLLVDLERPRVNPHEPPAVALYAFLRPGYMKTQTELICSPRVIKAAVEKIGAAQWREFNPPATSEQLHRAIQEGLRAEPLPESWIIEISYESPLPDHASQMANAVAESYLECMRLHREQAIQVGADTIGSKLLPPRRREFEEANEKFVAFRNKHHLSPSDEVQNPYQQERDRMVSASLEAQRKLLQAALEFSEAQRLYYPRGVQEPPDPEGLLRVPAVFADALFQQYKKQIAELESAAIIEELKYGPENPLVIAQARTLQAARKRQFQHALDLYRVLESRYHQAQAEAEKAAEARQKSEEPYTAFKANLARYLSLKEDRDHKKAAYDLLFQHFKETRETGEFKYDEVQIWQRAARPKTPSRPRKFRIVAVALLLGLMTGSGVAFARDRLDTRIRSHKDLEAARLPLLGVATNVKYFKTHEARALACDKASGGSFVEAVRALRTSLLLALPPAERGSVYLLTSPGANEGKTTIASNLAIMFAANELKVLLVDADLRHPMLHKDYCVDRAPGLVELLCGEARPEEIVRRTKIPHLDLCPSGRRVEWSTELLHRPAAGQFIQWARRNYQVVVLDTPPAGLVSDAVLLAPLADGVLEIVRSHVTTRGQAARCAETLRQADAKLLGVVVNITRPSQEGYGEYGYRYHYGQRYYRAEEQPQPEARV